MSYSTSTNRAKNEPGLEFTNSIAHVLTVQSCSVIEDLIEALVVGGISSLMGSAFITPQSTSQVNKDSMVITLFLFPIDPARWSIIILGDSNCGSMSSIIPMAIQ